jgi:Predicted metal-dependent phosphoesterases (PHP family)
VDLHIHSTASDGTDTPSALVQQAFSLGLEAIALTDHDTMDGVSEGSAEAEKVGLEFIPGCELAAYTPFGEMHIVCLWMDPEKKDIASLLAWQNKMREARNREILEMLKTVGIDISYEELESENGSMGRPHIARAILRRGYANSLQDAFKRFLVPGRAAFVPRKLMQPEEILETVKKSGVTTVFAHPMALPAPKTWLEQLVESLAETRLLDCLEAYHPEHDNSKTRYVEGLAARHKLLLSGGSDYHGLVKPKVQLGRGEGKLRVPVELLNLMKKQRAANLSV